MVDAQRESDAGQGHEPAADAADEHDSIDLRGPGVGPEDDVAQALGAALVTLRKQADALEDMPLDEKKVAAAEAVADAAAKLDEELGSIARSDDS